MIRSLLGLLLALFASGSILAADPGPSITLLRYDLARLATSNSSPAFDSLRAKALFELTRLYIEKADSYAGADEPFDSAVYFNRQHLGLAHRLKWNLEEAEALTFRAKIAHMRNDFDESYQSALQALSIFARYPPAQCRNLFECLHRMGRIHFKTLEEYAAALGYFERALAVTPDPQQRVFMLRQIGTCYSKMARPAEARRYYEQSLAMAKRPYDRAMCLNFLGELSRTTGDTLDAIRLFNEALNADNHVMVQSAALNYLAETYWHLRQPAQAQRYAERALQQARLETNNLADRAQAYRLLYLTHQFFGQSPEALRFHELYLATRDSLSNKDGLKKYYALQISQQRTDQQEKEAIYEQEIQQQRQIRNLTLAIAGLFFLLGFTLLLGYRAQRRKNAQIARQSAEITAQNVTIMEVQRQLARSNQQLRQVNHSLEDKIIERTSELLKANQELLQKNEEVQEALFKGQSIERKRVASELHDNLGGLLAAARMSIKVLDPSQLSTREQKVYENALQLISDAYREVRLISHNLLPEELEKTGLSESLHRLVEKLNLSHYVRFNLDVAQLDRRLDKQTEFNLYNICLELTNNILKHSGATEASIRFARQQNQLTLTVADNGRGISTEILPSGEQSDGMGMRNVRSRAESIGAALRIESVTGAGTMFEITLSLTETPPNSKRSGEVKLA